MDKSAVATGVCHDERVWLLLLSQDGGGGLKFIFAFRARGIAVIHVSGWVFLVARAEYLLQIDLGLLDRVFRVRRHLVWCVK